MMGEIVRANYYCYRHRASTPLSHFFFFTFIELRVDDSVLIRNCPPVSARKRFTLDKVVRSPETERDIAHAAAVATPTVSPSPTPTL